MKRTLVVLLALVMLALAACSSPAPAPSPTPDTTPVVTPTPVPKAMSASSAGIVEGKIAPEYGAKGSQKKSGTPTRSLPLTIADAPQGTVCYAILMRDPDSKPLAGYEWTHWLVVNLKVADLPANASIDLAAQMVQGKNDFGPTGYGGPTPPDKTHTYVIEVYALDGELSLKAGFTKKQFTAALEGHVLAQCSLTGSYDK